MEQTADKPLAPTAETEIHGTSLNQKKNGSEYKS